jgi:hypothetical protein
VAKFQPGTPGGPGRPRGVKNKLSVEFLNALIEDFREGGAAAIKICRIENPVKYTAIIASLMPRDLAIETSKMGELTDDELGALIEHVRQTRAKLIEHKPELELITNGKDRSAAH